VATYRHGHRVIIIPSVYLSETACWSDVSTTVAPITYLTIGGHPSLLVGNTIHRLLFRGKHEIHFELDTYILALVEIENGTFNSRLIHSEDGGVSLASLSPTVPANSLIHME
jgi:hypothetical protein